MFCKNINFTDNYVNPYRLNLSFRIIPFLAFGAEEFEEAQEILVLDINKILLLD